MAAVQIPIHSNGPVSENAKGCPFIHTAEFHWGSVDAKLNAHNPQAQILHPEIAAKTTNGTATAPEAGRAPQAQEPLGPLAHFKGTWTGPGFNTIFRPNGAAPTTTQFAVAVTPAPPQTPSENVLELNLTEETLSFSSPLGSVPNRGKIIQSDIFLNGVPYVQSINDVTNEVTGGRDGAPVGIHFEPGLWMHVPATNVNPVVPASLCRMGSIPHGATVNAQCMAPTVSVAGPPRIPPVDITPFFVNNGVPQKIPFESQHATLNNTPRIPQDLTKFIKAGTITQEILDDPNTVLRNAIKGQDIISSIVFTVSTTPQKPALGGGAANIAFLDGTDPTGLKGPNASVETVQATVWIETVQYELELPAHDFASGPLTVHAKPAQPGASAPTFTVLPPAGQKPKIDARTMKATGTQLQTSQTVFLNFSDLIWPHVSVSTLVPTAAQEVTLTW